MIVLALLPAKGFLGTGATFEADVNLIAQLMMGAALIAGFCLAKQKRYTAHGICQTTVLLLNVLMIGLVMWPSFHQQVKPHFLRVLHTEYYAVPTVHAVLGITAELLGLYIVLVTKTETLSMRLRFRNWKRWMQMEFMLWLVVLITGVATYYAWYIAPFR